MDSKITIGVTGGIGSGKSLICRIISTLGYPVFYSDQEAKLLYTEDSEVKAQVIDLFGEEVYQEDQLNKTFLSNAIYSDSNLKSALEQIIHPAVRRRFAIWAETQTSQLVFNEAAILFETGANENFDFTILVCSPLELRTTRIMKRDSLSREDVLRRFDNQWTDEQKRRLASYIIENNEDELLIPQVINTINQIKQGESV